MGKTSYPCRNSTANAACRVGCPALLTGEVYSFFPREKETLHARPPFSPPAISDRY